MAKTLFTRLYSPGTVVNPNGRRYKTFLGALIREDGQGRRVLSITGVEGPTAHGNATGDAGQITGFAEHIDRWSDGWDAARAEDFTALWRRWHLNDMRPGCAHQMATGWTERRINKDKPATDYGYHFPGQSFASYNLFGWVRPDEHQQGLLGVPCPTCGAKYGSAWYYEDLPLDIVETLRGWPEVDLDQALSQVGNWFPEFFR
jgi:hypothetical protein